IGATMALDDHAAHAEKDGAVNRARVHLGLERAQGLTRENSPKLAEPVHAQGVGEIRSDLARGSLGGLQGDIAGEAFRDDDVHGALAKIVSLDEAVIDEVGAAALGQDPASFLYGLKALDLLGTDIEQAHARSLHVEKRPREGRAQDRKNHE